MNKLKLIVNHQKSCFWYRGVKTLHIPLALEKMRGGNVGGGFAGNKFLAGRFFNYSTWAAFKGREACVRWTSHSLFERAPWQASQRGAEKFFQSPTGGLARAKTQVKYFSSFYSKVGFSNVGVLNVEKNKFSYSYFYSTLINGRSDSAWCHLLQSPKGEVARGVGCWTSPSIFARANMSTVSDNNSLLQLRQGDELFILLNNLEDFDISKDDLNNLEEFILTIGELLSVSKLGVTKRGVIELKRNLGIEFKKLGVKVKDIESIVNYISNISELNNIVKDINVKDINVKDFNSGDKKILDGNGKGEQLLLKLIEIASNKNVNLDDKLLEELIDLFNLLGSYNYSTLNNIIDIKMNKLILVFKNLISIDKREIYRKRKMKIQHLNISHYTKVLNSYLKSFINECKIESVNYFMKRANIINELLPHKFKPLQSVISKLYDKNIDMLSRRILNLEYSKNSMKDLVKIKEDVIRKFKDNVNLDGIRNMDILIKSINDNLRLSNHGIHNYFNRLNKFDIVDSNHLVNILKNIIDDDTLELNERQLMIENATLEYDLN